MRDKKQDRTVFESYSNIMGKTTRFKVWTNYLYVGRES